MIDYLIVGAGLYGATFARWAKERHKECIVVDKRSHIGGNVYTERKHGIDVHKYGPHIFHTNSEMVWRFVNRFAEFNDYRHKVLSYSDMQHYSFPLNLKTLEQLWPGLSDEELIAKFESGKSEHQVWENLEDWAIAEVGEEIYRKFIYGYTKKHWGTEPANLPAFIINRLPVRQDRNDDYHKSRYSGIPKCGYTKMVENMLEGTDVILDTDFLENREFWEQVSDKIVYTGAIDEFFNYEFGELEWRSLRFEEHEYDQHQVQQVAQINYPQDNVEYTRTVEHKHFNDMGSSKSIVTFEYPQKYKKGLEKYYPINDCKNQDLYKKYKEIIPDQYIFGGRLAEYKYYDMHQVIGAAISRCRKLGMR